MKKLMVIMMLLAASATTNTALATGKYKVGPQGPQGPMGKMGPRGFNGADGTNGLNGLNGLNGINGLNFNDNRINAIGALSAATAACAAVGVPHKSADHNPNSINVCYGHLAGEEAYAASLISHFDSGWGIAIILGTAPELDDVSVSGAAGYGF